MSKPESQATKLSQERKFRPPQIDLIMRQKALAEPLQRFKRSVVKELVKESIKSLAENYSEALAELSPEDLAIRLAEDSAENLEKTMSSLGIREVINATGVLLSTNLGRAPLPEFAAHNLYRAVRRYSNLEFDLEEGERGERTKGITRLIKLITGAEAAIVVNNNASAVMLAVRALALGKEVLVSRGELIEIGGSFRLPDVIEASGGRLKEVGATNKTRLQDFERVLQQENQVGMLMKCHQSNFKIVGFTEEASLGEMISLGKKYDKPVVYDLGGGSFVDLSTFGLKKEPTVEETLEAGVDLLLFSGDKLLGGPQAGIIAGKAHLVEKLRKCPMYRALRADKVVISLVEAALSQYLLSKGFENLPVFQMAGQTLPELRKRAANILAELEGLDNLQYQIEVSDCLSTMGGGSLPGENLASLGLRLKSKSKEFPAKEMARILRLQSPAVIGIVSKEAVNLDLRTVFADQDQTVTDALKALNLKMCYFV